MYNVSLIYKDGTEKRFQGVFKFRCSDTRFYCWWREAKVHTWTSGSYQYYSTSYKFASLKNIAEIKIEVL